MNNSYCVEQETMSKPGSSVGSTIPGRFGSLLLLGLVILSLVGCKGGGSGSGSSMQITPPSGNGPDLVIHSISVSQETIRPGHTLIGNVTVRNQGNRRSGATTLEYTYIETSEAHRPIQIERLDPLETSPTIRLVMTAPLREGTYHVEACVTFVSGETDTSNNCKRVRVTVREESGGGGSGGGSGGSPGRPVTSTWSCPFGDGQITVPAVPLVTYDAEIRFRGNTCGGFYFWLKTAAPTSVGLIDYNGSRPIIRFLNDNSSGRTVVTRHTVVFCRASEVSIPLDCVIDRYTTTSSTLTVRWLSE